MKLITSFCFLVLALTTTSLTAFGQTETVTGVEAIKDITLLRRDLRADKKQLIALNVPLTETEATKFWPLYDQYVVEITKPFDKFYGAIKEFAAKQKVISDAETTAIMKRWADALVEIAQTRQRYLPIFEKILTPKKAAIFIMADRRLYALIDLQVVSETPLLPLVAQ